MPPITQRTLAHLESTGQPYFIRDGNLRGFGIKVTARGRSSYFVEARVRGGRTVRRQIGNVDHLSLDDARTEARRLLHLLSTGQDVARRYDPPPEPEPASLGQALETYLSERSNLKPSTRDDYRKVFSGCFADWSSQRADRINSDLVGGRYRELRERTSEAYAAKALRTLRAILNFAGVSPNPVSRFLVRSGVPSTAPPRTRFLSGHEIEQIMSLRDVANYYRTYEPFNDLLMFYLLTGCRKSEALSVLKTDCTSDTFTIRETKNGRPHTIPLEGWLVGIIQRRTEADDGPRLWNYSDSTFRTKLKQMQRFLAFKEPWTTHDLRRTFAEHCHLTGVDENVIAACLNHTPTGVTAHRGRKPSIDRERVRELHSRGIGPSAIAREMGIGRASVYRLLD